MYLNYYLKQLGYYKMPTFLKKYLKTPCLLRLKKVGYFCGMDYASKDIYNFKEYISRYDHSLTVCLLTYKLTKNKEACLAGLFHDVATPCFSHVIDYMNKDYNKQESTEEYTEKIIRNDKYLENCLKKDKININDIINFKKYSVVDNERPKICADRLDGIILTGISWTKNIDKNHIKNILNSLILYQNEDKEEEIGFKDEKIAKLALNINKRIDLYCHSNEDNYMMELLANITKYAIKMNYITYDDLYRLDEQILFSKLKNLKDKYLDNLILKFETIKSSDIENIDLPKIKKRIINPLVNGKRIY